MLALIFGISHVHRHLDEEPVVEYLVDDPVVPDPDAVGALLAHQRGAAGRPRLTREEIDGRADALLLPAGKPGEGLDCPPRDLDPVAGPHTRPRSALTSSQGT